MTWLKTMMETPEGPAPVLARYTSANGVLYAVIGLSLYAAPDLMRTLFFMPPLEGQDEGLYRAIGIAVFVIGWLYFFGGRTRAASFSMSTVGDRLLIPVLILPLGFTGQLGWGLVLAFAILDPVLALGAYLLWKRSASAH